eukprot:TRINITY_DN2318_c2_g1_i1.p1 TRINITY_DN2318_c2_g1~~TRINITY_DN2318_c2_g1_i1.p1  ORF type:complete len:206 (+),score=80.85 TRINITY_DN2318_c2_g1_i1:84-620(+)
MAGKKGKGKPKEMTEDEKLDLIEQEYESYLSKAWELERLLVIEAEKFQRYKLVQLDLKREIAGLGKQMKDEEKLTETTCGDMSRQYGAMQQELCHRIGMLQQTIDSLREELDTQRQTLERTKLEKDEIIAQKNKKINEQKQQMENMAIDFGNMLKETLETMSQRMDSQGGPGRGGAKK